MVDLEGNVAAAVSSGGLAMKHPGRVGQVFSPATPFFGFAFVEGGTKCFVLFNHWRLFIQVAVSTKAIVLPGQYQTTNS